MTGCDAYIASIPIRKMTGCDAYIASIPIRKFSYRFGYKEPSDKILMVLRGVPRGSIVGRIPIKRQRLFLYNIFLNKVIQQCNLRCYELDNFSNYFPYVSPYKINKIKEYFLYYLIRTFFNRKPGYIRVRWTRTPMLSR